MAKLYFGKFTKPEQITGHYYLGSDSWFNGIAAGDYAFVLNKGEVKGLWKARRFEPLENNEKKLCFDEIISDFGMPFRVEDLVVIKKFKLTMNVCVKTMRSTGSEKKGFFEITLLHPDEIDAFLTEPAFTAYIHDERNFRNIRILQDEEAVDHGSADVQIYKKDSAYCLHKADFIDPAMADKFNDTVGALEALYESVIPEKAPRSKKLKTIKALKQALERNAPIPRDQLSIFKIYDVFFSSVKLPSASGRPQVAPGGSAAVPFTVPNSINTILYGPPGTGKTYATKGNAVAICKGTKDKGGESVAQDYEALVKEGRIHFVTFHQSFGYEEFVEGIKPLIPEDDSTAIGYEVRDGILKTAAIQAMYEYVKAKRQEQGSAALEDTFDNRWDQMLSELRKKLDEQKPGSTLHFKTKVSTQLYLETISERGNLKFKVTDTPYTVSRERTRKLWNAFSDVKEIKNIDREFRAVIGGSNSVAYYITLEYLQKMKFIPADTPTVSDENLSIEEKKKYTDELGMADFRKPDIPKHVLIIDEINRGNTAQIFGELITLLEKSKRAGAADAVKVRLSYSGEPFILPPNLYIIATMNTSDRSVETLDTALRRRFSFEELAPKSEELDEIRVIDESGEDLDINLDEMLDVINKRLEFLLDRDHTIGHAYFLPDVNQSEDGNFIVFSDLKRIFEHSIIPQLKEYFYNDWGKIRLVLSPKFVKDRTDAEFSKLFFVADDDALDKYKKLFSVSAAAEWDAETFQSIYKKTGE